MNIKGFCQVKKKSKKNSEVGGWVKPPLGFFPFFLKFCGFFVFFVGFIFVVHVSKKKKKWIGGWVLANPSFSRIFGFFLT